MPASQWMLHHNSSQPSTSSPETPAFVPSSLCHRGSHEIFWDVLHAWECKDRIDSAGEVVALVKQISCIPEKLRPISFSVSGTYITVGFEKWSSVQSLHASIWLNLRLWCSYRTNIPVDTFAKLCKGKCSPAWSRRKFHSKPNKTHCHGESQALGTAPRQMLGTWSDFVMSGVLFPNSIMQTDTRLYGLW